MDFNLDNPSRRKTSKILTIGNYSVMIIDIIQGLVFVPLYLMYIGERLYGFWLGTGGVISVLAFMDMGIATLTIQRVSREFGKKDFKGISKYFSGGFLINFCFMVLLLAIGFVGSLWLDSLFTDMTISESQSIKQAFRIALLALVITLLNNTIEGILKALQKPLLAKIFHVSGAIIGIIVTYILLLGSNPLLAIPLGMLVRSVISLIPSFIILILIFKKNEIALFTLRVDIIKDYLSLTPNLFLSKIGTSMVGNIEPTLINIFLTPEIAVFFSVTKKAGKLVKKIVDRVGGIIYPSLAHLHSEASKSKFSNLFFRAARYLLPGTMSLFFMYALLNEQFVSLWVGHDKYLGDLITVLIGLSLFMTSLSNLLSYLLSSTGDIKFANNSVFIESITKIIFLVLLLKVLGVYGLPLASLITGLIFGVVYLIRWNKHLDLDRKKNISFAKELIFYFGILFFLSIGLNAVINSIDVNTYLSFAIIGGGVFIIVMIVLFSFNKNYRTLLFRYKS